jgi:hypothetical protein
MSRWIVGASFACLVGVQSADAGLHLGMKLACKRYGDAWAAGDRAALQAAVTEDFAAVWQRIPESMFAKLPKSDSADSAVLASQKSPTGATVSVQTQDGVIVFHLQGTGFQWRVADLEVSNLHGEAVSLKQSLEASLTSRDFLIGLADPAGKSWNGCLSRSMQQAINALSPEEWRHIQAYLPKLSEPAMAKKPMVRFFDRLAVLNVTMPGGDSSVQVTLVNEGAWKVDDLELSGRSLRIPSFRKGMPAMAAVAKLGRFMKDPKSIDPSSFIGDQKLLEELAFLRTGKVDAGGLGSQKMEHLRIAHDVLVYVKYPNRWIAVTTKPAGGRAMVSNLQLHDGGAWRNAADLLALQRKVKTSPLADWLGSISMSDRSR